MIALTCKRALELILDAEPSELSLDGDTALVGHLTNCARCRAVAKRLVEQTAMVMAEVKAAPAILEMPARPDPVVRSRWPLYAGVAAAAALTLFVLTREARSPQPVVRSLGQGTRAVDTGTAPQIAKAAPTSAPVRRPAAPRVEPRAEPIRAIAVAPQRFEVANASAAVREFRDRRNADTSRVISVAPPAGVRATVLATSNPAVTVIWLQAADTSRNPR